MREIGFIGISNDASYGKEDYFLKMVYSNSIMQTMLGDQVFETKLLVDGEWLEVNKSTLGLYTGLKDKNGTKIYEGDIVEFRDEDEDYDQEFRLFHYVVIWDDYDSDFKITGGVEGYTTNFFYMDNNEQMAVVGNIHQTPELLIGEPKYEYNWEEEED